MNNLNYKKYIESLTKEELIEKILGSDYHPPLLTRNEPTYSRPQILWGIKKCYDESEKKVSLEEADEFVDDIMNKIEGYKWDSFYNYDWIRFDIRKPSFYWVSVISILSMIGIIYTIWAVVSFIINVIEWIY